MAPNNGSVDKNTVPDGATLQLRACRQRRGLSLEEIADRTKISIRFLRAIEAEEFEQLPGGIFATSYLRQYAAAVGADEVLLLESYHSRSAHPNECETTDSSVVRQTIVKFLRASMAAR